MDKQDNGFLSLKWYDDIIEFVFKFVAKTSEPLLALGVVISSVNFMQHGGLMGSSGGLFQFWTWGQGIAIETSGGVMLGYGLQDRRDGDVVKGWLEIILAAMLLATGTVILGMEFVSSIKGWSESTLPDWYIYSMSALRSIVSIGYVALCRTKHLRYSGQVEVAPVAVIPQQDFAKVVETLTQRIEKLETTPALLSGNIPQIEAPNVSTPAVVETLLDETETQVGEVETQRREMETQRRRKVSRRTVRVTTETSEEEEDGLTVESLQGIDLQIFRILKNNRELSSRAVAAEIGCSHTLVNKKRDMIEALLPQEVQ